MSLTSIPDPARRPPSPAFLILERRALPSPSLPPTLPPTPLSLFLEIRYTLQLRRKARQLHSSLSEGEMVLFKISRLDNKCEVKFFCVSSFSKFVAS
jgi:hypothetical protein